MLNYLLSFATAFALLAHAQPTAEGCTNPKTHVYWFPIMTTAFESIENLVRQPADFPFDGWALEIFPESITVKVVGSGQIKRNVLIPAHIPSSSIRKGMPVRLGEHQGQPILLAIFPQLQGDVNYAGKGSVIPSPPLITVTATSTGWLVSWAAIPGADRYRVYRNDTADETSPDEVCYTNQTSVLIPYESPFIYFAVRSVSGLNESELSGWLTDNTPPNVPDTFSALNDISGHQLTISGTDAALQDQGFQYFEIQQATDGSGTGAASLGNFYLKDFPVFRSFGRGTVRYYRIRAIDWAGNASDWTAWDYAYSGQSEIQDKFDGYGGSVTTSLSSLWWLKIANLDTSEPWTVTAPAGGSIADTTDAKEGGAKQFTPGLLGGLHQGYIKWTLSTPLDLSNDNRFTDDDYVVFSVYKTGTRQDLHVQFWSGGFYRAAYVNNLTLNAWNHIKVKRSDMTGEGETMDWSNVTMIAVAPAYISGGDPSAFVMIADDIRIVKADPDDSATFNDTGHSWDRAANTGTNFGEWHIYSGNRTGEPAKPFSYGQIKTATSPAVWYFSHKPLNTTQIYTGTIQTGIYLKGTDGQAGLAFFVKDVTAGSWDMYVVEADSAADQIRLVRWVGGTRTVISTASFTFAPDQVLWLGADFKDYDSDGGRIKVYASFNEGNVLQAVGLIISAQDTNVGTGGSVGLLSYQANVRFMNFRAGSPEHAETADVAYALDGPIVAGETRRVRYNRDNNEFEYSDDGTNYKGVATLGEAIGLHQGLPGLIGFWPMSSIQRSSGNAYDLSGQGRTLTYNGNPTYNIYNDLVPYIDLDGTGDYLSRANETDLRVLGTETIYASAARGLTMGGWFWFDNLGGVARGLMSKNLGSTNQRSYLLLTNADNNIWAQVSVDGIVGTIFDTGITPSTGQWYNIIFRFVPSTSMDIYINGTKYTYTTSIPASIFNSTANFEIGSYNGGTNNLDGRASLCFLCANALPDSLIALKFRRERGLFGV